MRRSAGRVEILQIRGVFVEFRTSRKGEADAEMFKNSPSCTMHSAQLFRTRDKVFAR